MEKLKLVSLIVPVFNENSLTLNNLLTAVNKLLSENSSFNFELILIDDSTQLETRILTRNLATENTFVRTIHFSRNFGKESALRAGMEYARGDAVIPMDSDLQDPIEIIRPMIDLWTNGNMVVLARRIDRTSDSFVKKFWAHFFYKLMKKIADIDIPENVGDFRLMDRQVVNSILQLQEKSIFMKGIYAWVGFETTTLDYVRPKRSEGKTKFSFNRLVRVGLDGMVSFSSLPLRIWSALGVVFGFLAILWTLTIIALKIFNKIDMPGYASLISISLFSTAINLFCFGIFGEYISRLFIEIKNRPHFVIEKTYGFAEN